MENVMQQQPPLTPEELTGDSRPSIAASNITVAVLASIAVIIRFWARECKRSDYRADDYLVAVATVVGWGLVAATMVAADNGLGEHFRKVMAGGASSVVLEGQAYLASGILYALDIGLVKISTLLLYLRIFNEQGSLRWTTLGLGVLTTCWFIVVLLVSCFQCLPISSVWDSSVQGTCIDSWLFFTIMGAINTTTTFFLLALPIPSLSRLQLGGSELFSLIGIYLVGVVTCIASIMRLVTVVQSHNTTDPTWTQGMVSIWTTVEPCLGIIATSLPALRPCFPGLAFIEPPPASSTRSPEPRSHSQTSSRPLRRSFDWTHIELGKGMMRPHTPEWPMPKEGVIEVHTTWETRHSYRKNSNV